MHDDALVLLHRLTLTIVVAVIVAVKGVWTQRRQEGFDLGTDGHYGVNSIINTQRANDIKMSVKKYVAFLYSRQHGSLHKFLAIACSCSRANTLRVLTTNLMDGNDSVVLLSPVDGTVIFKE